MLYDWSMESNYITDKWRRISQSEIRNSAAAESEGGQKFLPPNPLPFCPPERSVWRAKRAINSVQNRFGFRQTNAPVLNFQEFCQRIQPREARKGMETLAPPRPRGPPTPRPKTPSLFCFFFFL